MKKIKVYLDNQENRSLPRVIVIAELVKENPLSIWVTLPTGQTIKRKIKRDCPEGLKIYEE